VGRSFASPHLQPPCPSRAASGVDQLPQRSSPAPLAACGGAPPRDRAAARRGRGAVATVKCSAITKGGTRCRLDATHGSYCYQHAPETAEERKRNARRGGKAGGNGRSSGFSETAEARRRIKAIVEGLLRGEVDRDTATACFMGLNVLARYVELERKLEEAAVREEFEELKRELGIA
jgi:hypothetical protein